MQQPPRRRSERLLNAGTLLRAYAWLGAIEAGLCLTGYYWAQWLAGWRLGQPLAAEGPAYLTATTMSLAGIVACQVGNVLACRSSRASICAMRLTGNRLLWWGVAAECAILAVLIYVPPLAQTFGLAPLHAEHWALLAAYPPILLGLEECRKAVVRHWARRAT
jgi:magnesium-transporting ATPase (P-type)